MMKGKKIKFRSIRTRLTFWLLIIALSSMIVVNIAIYKYIVNTMKISMYNKLEANRDLKLDELIHWLSEKSVTIRTIAAADEVRAVREVGDVNQGTHSSEARSVLWKYIQNYDDFHEMFIVSPVTNTILVSTDWKNEGKAFTEGFQGQQIVYGQDLTIHDIRNHPGLNKPSMVLSLPVFSLVDRKKVIGILVAGIDLETSLFSLLSNRTGMGDTGEALIVNREAVALSELRWHPKSPLRFQLTSKPAEEASQGRTGIMEATDYRGARVLAAYTHIPMTGWGFIAKQDMEELFEPINQLRNWMFIIGIITLFGVITVAFTVSKSISTPIKELHRGSEIIGGGNLDHKVGTDAPDEIGELSRTFDRMILNLKITTASRDELNREIAERKGLEQKLLAIEENERRRIGHDLHDNLGQQLTAISFKTQGLENILRKKSIPEAEDLARITYLVEMTKAQAKSLSFGLSPLFEKDDYCLMTAMVELASNSERLFEIPCVVKCSRPVSILNKSTLIHLYRIAQEAITNSARHAKPERIEIGIRRDGQEVTLTIQDNGSGFSVSDQPKGMGLEIMRYRASIINASLEILPEINRGTRVTCTFLDHRNDEINSVRQRGGAFHPLLE